MTWLDLIRMELENFDDPYSEPYEEVAEDDIFIGIAGEDLRKMYSLAMKWEKSALENLLASRFARSKEEEVQLTGQAFILHKKSDLLKNIFWTSVRDEFDLWQSPLLSIRLGWKVVQNPPEDS